MNARILKKLCKRATPYVKEVCEPSLEFFKTGSSYPESFVAVKFNAKHIDGRHESKRHCIKAFHGTDLIGITFGYYDQVTDSYEPEMVSRHTYDMLSSLVMDYFSISKWSQDTGLLSCYVGPHIRCRSDVFKAAKLMVQQIKEAKK